MGMNIKDPDVHAMIKELAQLTGLTLTAAVKWPLLWVNLRNRVSHQNCRQQPQIF